MTAASIISRSASGSASLPKRDSTCQRRARNPSTWSVMPATPKTTPAGQLGSWPARTMRTTKKGMRPSRAMGRAAAEAAAEAGIELVLLHVAYARGGIERFRQESFTAYLHELEELRGSGIRVGVAPHSVRACPRDWLEELGRYAVQEELPLHM